MNAAVESEVGLEEDEAPARLTLGPLMFNWAPDKWRDFYFRIADEAPVDTVHLGEVICSKRLPFLEPLLPEVIERLTAAGKEVVLSTLALVMDKRDMAAVRSIAAMEGFLIEANDLAAGTLLNGRPHVVGPFVNVYNEGTLAYLARQGAVRVCLPVELPATSLGALVRTVGPELEVFAFGRLPLALSARCYHARAHGLHKDSCNFVCGEDPDGMPIETLDGAAFLAVNGTQTLSHSCCLLLEELEELRAMGIRRFRLSPQSTDMVEVARLFRAVLDEQLDPEAAMAPLTRLAEGMPLSNGFYHGREGAALCPATT